MERVKFLQHIEAFLKRTGMSATRFSKEVTGDPTYIATLRRGRETKESKQNRVFEFIEKYEKEREE